jgi:hypothetical protein
VINKDSNQQYIVTKNYYNKHKDKYIIPKKEINTKFRSKLVGDSE